jgi:FKBP-type peptidyl-prolyl cis-trans isomerase FkpA/FKBP-type peptidyl-prolyl cis-trans isomerase FklB
MNKLVLGGLVVALAATTACTKKVKLDTDIKKASYAIGQQIGGNLKQQNIDFDSDALAQALKDASAGKNEMSKEDMQAAMMKLQEMAMKKQSEVADTNAKAGKEFLEKNKSAAGIKTTASGLQYIMEKEGTGASPKKEDVVKVHYKGTLTNGEQFDSSYDRGQPAEFPVGGVIPGWTEALQLMKVGGKAKLFIPPELAYGPSGRPGIPPNSVLVFEVELMDIVKADAKKAKK